MGRGPFGSPFGSLSGAFSNLLSLVQLTIGLGLLILQFKVADGMQSATTRAIYDTENDDVAIFSRTTMLPK